LPHVASLAPPQAARPIDNTTRSAITTFIEYPLCCLGFLTRNPTNHPAERKYLRAHPCAKPAAVPANPQDRAPNRRAAAYFMSVRRAKDGCPQD
jgi:hypothetical protein